ncbi:MAG: glycosyltransferase family 2 protein [Peptococcaceae bacterium]|nr:MAG: glycosyltransferase family 2 protein [Peptococcaceae bacterium]
MTACEGKDSPLFLPFEVYTGNLLIARVVELAGRGLSLNVLVVYNGGSCLREFLNPGCELRELNFDEFAGGGFADHSFDAVALPDFGQVLPEERPGILAEAFRIAGKAVILGASFFSGETVRAAEMASGFFAEFDGRPGFSPADRAEGVPPDDCMVEEFFKVKGCPFAFFEYNNLENWLWLKCFSFYAGAGNMPEGRVRDVYRLYNSYCELLGDFSAPGFRKLFVASKRGESLCLPSPAPADHFLRQVFFRQLLDYMLEQAREPDGQGRLLRTVEKFNGFGGVPFDAGTSYSRLLHRFQEKDEELRETFNALTSLTDSRFYGFVEGWERLRERLFPGGSKRRAGYDFLQKILSVLLDCGPAGLFSRSFNHLRKYGLRGKPKYKDYDHHYQLMIAKMEPKPENFPVLRRQAESFPRRPLISIVMVVGDPLELRLKAAVESVCRQVYPYWDLCLGVVSAAPEIKAVLAEYCRRDGRIKATWPAEGESVPAVLNAALELAAGEFVGILDQGDELSPTALLAVAKLVNSKPETDFIYTDEDQIGPDRKRERPFFKPGWSPDLLMSMNYIGRFIVFRRSLLEKAGGFRWDFTGDWYYDLILRLTESAGGIAHIPEVLCHCRRGRESGLADGGDCRTTARSLEEALDRRGLDGRVETDGPGRYRVRYTVKGRPLVSIIIPTKDKVGLLRRCLSSIEERSAYRPYEIIVVNNRSVEEATRVYLDGIRKKGFKVLDYNKPFNFAAINNFAAGEARGDYLLFLNNDVEVITPGWLEEMLGHAQRPEAGAVGAKLLYPDATVQHAGMIAGFGGVAGHAFYQLPGDDPGYMGLAAVVRNCAAVTGACFLIRREVFEEVGGFDEKLAVVCNDVDLCLKIVEKGYFIVWTPHAVLYHYETVTRGRKVPKRDNRYFRKKWRHFLQKGDPFYNPNLALDRTDYMIRIF